MTLNLERRKASQCVIVCYFYEVLYELIRVISSGSNNRAYLIVLASEPGLFYLHG